MPPPLPPPPRPALQVPLDYEIGLDITPGPSDVAGNSWASIVHFTAEVSRHDMCCHLGCILLKMPATTVRTGECMLFRPPKPDSNYVQVVAIVQRRHRFYK